MAKVTFICATITEQITGKWNLFVNNTIKQYLVLFFTPPLCFHFANPVPS